MQKGQNKCQVERNKFWKIWLRLNNSYQFFCQHVCRELGSGLFSLCLLCNQLGHIGRPIFVQLGLIQDPIAKKETKFDEGQKELTILVFFTQSSIQLFLFKKLVRQPRTDVTSFGMRLNLFFRLSFGQQNITPHYGKPPAVTHVPFFQTACKITSRKWS